MTIIIEYYDSLSEGFFFRTDGSGPGSFREDKSERVVKGYI